MLKNPSAPSLPDANSTSGLLAHLVQKPEALLIMETWLHWVP